MDFVRTNLAIPNLLFYFLLTLGAAQPAFAEIRHCQAEWVATNNKTGEVAYLEAFEAAGGCSKTNPNDCRKKATDYAATCLKAHWNKRWEGERPIECKRSEIKGYDMVNLKAVLDGAACFYGWAQPGQQSLRLVGNVKGGNKCDWKTEFARDYKITPAICQNTTPRPVKKYIGNLAFDIPKNDTYHQRVGLRFPASMPKVRYPKGYKGCNDADKKKIDRGWAMATYMTWLGDKAMDWMHDNGQYRKAAWDHNYRAPNSSNGWSNYAPRGWFGAFNNDNFAIADNAIERLWRDRVQGHTFTVQCRKQGGSGSHPCFMTNPGGNGRPGANHIVYGKINFCAKALDGGGKFSDARRIIHEMLHWQKTKTGRFIKDTHTHCHGLARCTTDKAYGKEKSSHLANYTGGNRGTKASQRRRHAKHRDKALHNNDNYAYFLYYFGRMAHEGNDARVDGVPNFKQFPAENFNW